MAQKLTTFQVTGRGTFPLDMLRYDCCWPYESGDVSRIEYERGKDDPQEVRRVTLSTYGTPTEARWSSFGWSVDLSSVRRR